jgi:hypothetical protein
MPPFLRRSAPTLLLAAVLGSVFAAAPAVKPKADDKPRYFEGKVVPLADVVAKSGTKLDADAAPFWLALVADDGKVYPLVKDGGARMFFQDKALLNRPMRLLGKLLPNSTLLLVTGVQSLVKGVPHDVYYWCDVCSIRRSAKTDCECCGGKMELVEEPAKK